MLPFLMLESAKAGDALAVDHVSGGLLRRWRRESGEPFCVADVDMVAGQRVIVDPAVGRARLDRRVAHR